MGCNTYHDDAQDYYVRLFGDRPVEPYTDNEDPSAWAKIAEWERVRAEFFSYVIIYDDCEKAGRMVQ
jgi:hypothetical protein